MASIPIPTAAIFEKEFESNVQKIDNCMPVSVLWEGVYPALLTPFTADDQLDLPLFEKNLHAQLAAGVHGFIIGGSLGEASTLLNPEKVTLLKSALGVCDGRVPVLVNFAEHATWQAITCAQEAEANGAD